MEQIGEEQEVVANDKGGSMEFQGKDCDLALKLDGHNNLGSVSPIICPSLSENWPEGSAHYARSSQDLSRGVFSSGGSESPHTSPCFVKNAENVVGELTVGNFRGLSSAVARRPDTNKRVLSSNVLPNSDSRFKTLSSSPFAQLVMKRFAKGKAVVSRNQEAVAEFGSELVGQVDEKLLHARKVASDALMRSTAGIVRISPSPINRPGHESLSRGINLREWLKSGPHRKGKVESMMIFGQIVKLVDLAHSQGVALQDLRPSCFDLLPSNKIVYTGSSTHRDMEPVKFHDMSKKRPLEQDLGSFGGPAVKQQKLGKDMASFGLQSQFASSCGITTDAFNETGQQDPLCNELPSKNHANCQSSCMTIGKRPISFTVQLEQQWYSSPEQLNEGCSTLSSNIYSLGVLLYELLSSFESFEVQFSAMTDLDKRILPPKFLSENPTEAGFCLLLLHPESSSRPTTRQILQSELICQFPELSYRRDISISSDSDNVDTESEMLLHFLNVLNEQKQKHSSKLVEDIKCLEEDINEVEKRRLLWPSTINSQTLEKSPNEIEFGLHGGTSSDAISRSFSLNMNKVTLIRNIKQTEDAYFSMRSQIHLSTVSRTDRDLLKNRDNCFATQGENGLSNMNDKSFDPLGVFFEGLCKFARYSKFELRGSLKNGDLLNNTNVVCSLSFDRDEDYIAAAGVSKKIKIFEFAALLNDSMDVHYPVVEMSNKSKISCVCWNNYIKNYLASTDYDGVVQMWDGGTGQGFSSYVEHQKRAWSVNFSLADPMMFASGSDDCSVKLWSINQGNSIGTISSPANVCCVQFSSSSNHLLAFGSADYKIYCYDLRHTRIPWCTLAAHEKAVSYVKFLDSETLVSASTDNTLKLWDLNKTSSTGLSPSACSLTFSGHTNEKHFVGLSSLDGYIACGSETNEVYCYHRSLPMPITSYKFKCNDPFSGKEMGDNNGQFVSSVCWRQKSNMVVAANSGGNMKLLEMV